MGRCVKRSALARRRVAPLKVRFSLSEEAQVLVALKRRLNSRVHRGCPGPLRRGVKPGVGQDISATTAPGRAGDNERTLQRAHRRARRTARMRRLQRRRLRVHRRDAGRRQVRLAALLDGSLQPGTYQVLLRAYDAAGNRSPDITVKFWVLADGRASSKNRRRSR
jgi:hypothetical protein